MRERASVDRDLVAVRALPLGPSRTLQAERLVAEIEAEGPEASLAFAYLVLVEAYSHGGEGQKALVPFTRVLRLADSRPDLLDQWDSTQLLWASKWVIAEVIGTPEVPVERVDALLDDMERRFRLAGAGLDALHYLRMLWADERGTPDAEQTYEAWVATPRDEFSQCEVCDPGDRAAHLLECGRQDEGLRLIEKTLDEGRSCLSEPADMLSRAALAYLDEGRTADAVVAHRRTLAELDKADAPLVGVRSRALVFLARAGAHDGTLRRILADETILLSKGDSPDVQLSGLVAVGSAAALVARDEPDRELVSAVTGTRTVSELAAWCRREAEAIAARFDARYGNHSSTQWVADSWDLVRTPVDLSVLPAAPEPVDAPADPVEDAPAATPAPHVDAPTPTSDASTSIGDVLARAEALVKGGDLAAAAPVYAEVAARLTDDGMLIDAGFAWAEAAHCAQVLEDHEGADGAFARSVDLLRAGGAEPALLAPVVRAWAQSRCATDGCAQIRALLAEVRASLVLSGEETEQARRVDRARSKEAAEIDHTTARVLASTGLIDEAVEVATVAAERLAELKLDGPAAHAAWLVATLTARQGRVDDAIEWFRRAARGMGRVADKEQKVAVVDDLARMLNDAGREDVAETVADLLR